LAPPSGAVKTMIGRHATDRKKMTAMPKKGRLAVTTYNTLETFGNFSLVRLMPETGRTHQIRVHLAHLKHAVVGDATYGRSLNRDLPLAVNRQMLHAHKICFRHPETGKKMEFTAPMPDDMTRLLNYLRS
jgi:23S rRNA pseudouridine1911/1915/1917 synthase